ncbi:MAG: hypothetical protein ACRDQD_16370 [Nocardioidaceae bacterium]
MARTSNDAVWKVILAAAASAGVIVEARALHRGDDGTLCAWIRAVFHTDTPEGQAAFTAALTATLAGGGFVFWRHILKPIVKELS